MIKRTLLALLGALALIVGGLGAGSASADATATGGCRLSANWYVNFSAKWYGNGSDRDLSYVVITSPGRLFYGSASSVKTKALAWEADGDYWERSFDQVGTNPYTYRANFTGFQNATLVSVTAEAYPSGITCYDDFRP